MSRRCAQCGGPLNESPSDHWCSDTCQQRWTARHNLTRALPTHAPAAAVHHPPPIGLGYRGITLGKLLGRSG